MRSGLPFAAVNWSRQNLRVRAAGRTAFTLCKEVVFEWNQRGMKSVSPGIARFGSSCSQAACQGQHAMRALAGRMLAEIAAKSARRCSVGLQQVAAPGAVAVCCRPLHGHVVQRGPAAQQGQRDGHWDHPCAAAGRQRVGRCPREARVTAVGIGVNARTCREQPCAPGTARQGKLDRLGALT